MKCKVHKNFSNLIILSRTHTFQDLVVDWWIFKYLYSLLTFLQFDAVFLWLVWKTRLIAVPDKIRPIFYSQFCKGFFQHVKIMKDREVIFGCIIKFNFIVYFRERVFIFKYFIIQSDPGCPDCQSCFRYFRPRSC